MAKMSSEDVLETISEMTVLELSGLLKAFEEKFDVTAAAPVAMAAAAPAGGDAAAEEEQDEVDFEKKLNFKYRNTTEKEIMERVNEVIATTPDQKKIAPIGLREAIQSFSPML